MLDCQPLRQTPIPFVTPVKTFVGILVAFWLCNTIACAETLELSANRDTTIFADDPNASDGAGPVVFAGRTNRGGGSLRRALIHFDLSSLHAGSTITSVSLVLSVTRDPGTPPAPGTLRRILSSWGEAGSFATNGNGAPAQTGDSTWSHRFYGANGQTWAAAGGDLATTESATALFGGAGTSVTFASTRQLVADVQGWIDASATNQGWAVSGDELTVGSATQFASRESSNAALQPRLEISYTLPAIASDIPVFTPFAATVTVLALFGIGARQLRRRRA